MATTKFYITAGLPPDDNGADDGTTLFYITAGLPPDDTAAAAEAMPPIWKYLQMMRKS